MNCQQFNLVKSYREIYILGERKEDNSYINVIPSLSMTVAKARPLFSPDSFGLQTFPFTKDVGHQLIEVTMKRLQQSPIGTPSKHHPWHH